MKNQKINQEDSAEKSQYSFGIEAKVTLTYGTGEAVTASVENVHIRSVENKDGILYFDTDILVSVARREGASAMPAKITASSSRATVKTNLEICAVLSETLPERRNSINAKEGLQALTAVSGFPDQCYRSSTYTSDGGSSRHERVRHSRLGPVTVHVALTHALNITTESLASPNMGQTYVAITMAHSNTHKEPVIVTKITLHSGHSRQCSAGELCRDQQQVQNEEITGVASDDFTKTAAQGPVTDMSKVVRWVIAPKCDLGLPITLEPYDAYSTVLIIDATEDSCSRAFTCPMSITAVVGHSTDASTASGTPTSSVPCSAFSVVAGSDVYWTTSRAAIQPADAFRVEMTLPEGEGVVGVPLTCRLDISNMSLEAQDVMVLVDTTASSSSSSRAATVDLNISSNKANGPVSPGRKKPVKRAVVSEKAGRKFGIWGLLDNGPSSQIRPEDSDGGLLAVDVAMLLGELTANASKRAEMRFIPLRPGTLKLPNFVLIDRRRGKWYNASHNLRLVVQDRAPQE